MIGVLRGGAWSAWAAAIALALPSASAAQSVVPADAIAHVQNGAEALAQDAATLAAVEGIDVAEAERRLLMQENSVAGTDALVVRWRDRLAGLSIEQRPDFHVSVLLTGNDPVADEDLLIGADRLPVRYRIGASATRIRLLTALETRQAAIRASMPHPIGLGLDARTGTLVAIVPAGDVIAGGRVNGAEAIGQRLTDIAGVPVRVRAVDQPALDMAVEGGARVTGINPADGRRYACTTGFAVTDGIRDGVVTAAHCPDELSYAEPGDGADVPLVMAGQWGWGYQDVQVNVSPVPVTSLFYADTRKTLARPVTGQRSRASTRAGDVVCHRGERTGYSCAAVELTDFSPAGDLCGGPCSATWVTVAGPSCRGGDSGAPVFVGTTAFGIVKGGTYRPDGGCAFYFYMSTDYLPLGWALIDQAATVPGIKASTISLSEK